MLRWQPVMFGRRQPEKSKGNLFFGDELAWEGDVLLRQVSDLIPLISEFLGW